MGRGYNRDPTTGVLSVFDFVQSRKYYGLQIPIPSLIETLASWWTYQKYHTDRYDPNGYIQGRKTGLHLNFIPKYKIQVRRDADGGTIIQLDYWARIRKTGIVAAFVTYGVTAAIGAGTLSYHVMEAKHFLQAFWEWFDGSYQVVKVEVLVNEERSALEEEGYDEHGNVSKSVHSSTTNNYYNTYNQEPGYPPQPGYTTTSSSSKTVVAKSPTAPQSSGVVYPVSPPVSPVSPIPAAAGGGSYSSYSSSSSSTSSSGSKNPQGGYQTTITSHTTSSLPTYGMGSSVYGTPAYNSRYAPPPPGVAGYGMSSSYGASGTGLPPGVGQYGVGAMGTGQYGATGTSQYGSNYSNSSSYGSNGQYGNSGHSNSLSSGSTSAYSNNSYSGVPLDSMSKLSISGQDSNTSGSKQQQNQFVQSLFGSTPSNSSASSSGSTMNKSLPPPSTATVSGGSNANSSSGNNGYNSSLPPYPSTASTTAPNPPPVSHANLSNTNTGTSGTNITGTGQNGSTGTNSSTNGQGPYATGSYLGTEQDKKQPGVDYTSLRHGGLGFGYTYDHLKDDLKRKSENLNHVNNPSHGTANN
ncbi:hypothetical protein DICPUDRAFT_98124 [Dictyostelium purpureum]|uniref:Uncharacterized protein n=1 Tax=Dictyostelium purpureum TaxID=5786 RepID=F0ZMV8_DICPU|nr:uncharacterized protein DICPUDRAFT_98124 [Dictyostelium purpureum]EGC34709.1 hypothetical protein DICPUDRAFT_98124 [Dictyostelium purpureum]|eukprot:XP_003288750.1 hypothetical protein DICPUDRAFT_98124 [Dictyostelium purpureum]